MDEATNATCPLTIFPPEPYAYGKYFGLAVCCAVYPYVIVTTIWMWRRRNHFPLSGRRVPLISTTAFGILFASIVIPIRDFVGRGSFPCDLLALATSLWFPLITGPIIIRMFLTHNRLNFHRKINVATNDQIEARKQIFSEKGSGGSGSISASDLLKIQQHKVGVRYAKMIASPEYGVGLVVLLVIVCVGMFLWSLLSSDQYLKGCIGCHLTVNDIVTLGVGGVILMMCAMAVLFIGRFDSDAYGVIEELRLVLKVWGVMIAIWLPLELMDPSNLSDDEKINWGYIWFFTAVFSHTVSCTLQVRKTYIPIPRKLTDVTITLTELLEDAEGFDLFEKYLVSEFAAENISFWKDAKHWKNEFHNMSRVGRKEIAEFIVEDYIQEGAIMQTNLDDRMRNDCIARITDTEVQQDLFDAALDEVFKIMESDSFPRFLRSKHYDNYVNDAHTVGSISTRFKKTPFQYLDDESTSVHSSEVVEPRI